MSYSFSLFYPLVESFGCRLDIAARFFYSSLCGGHSEPQGDTQSGLQGREPASRLPRLPGCLAQARPLLVGGTPGDHRQLPRRGTLAGGLRGRWRGTSCMPEASRLSQGLRGFLLSQCKSGALSLLSVPTACKRTRCKEAAAVAHFARLTHI